MNPIRCVLLACAMSVGIAGPSSAEVHGWDIGEVFSNADGTIQFIELFVPNPAPSEWLFESATTTLIIDDGTPDVFSFPSDLDRSVSTAFASALLGTAGFAAAAGVSPDWIIPDGFVPLTGGTATLSAVGIGIIGLGDFETVSFGALPTGLNSWNFDTAGSASVALNSPTNFAGEVGFVPEPSSALLSGLGLVLLAVRSHAARAPRARRLK